jgi:hypothetical protein
MLEQSFELKRLVLITRVMGPSGGTPSDDERRALAMVVATQYPKPEEVGRGKKGSVAKQFPMVKKARLAEARTVIAYAPELVDAPMSDAWFSDLNRRCRFRIALQGAGEPRLRTSSVMRSNAANAMSGRNGRPTALVRFPALVW